MPVSMTYQPGRTVSSVAGVIPCPPDPNVWTPISHVSSRAPGLAARSPTPIGCERFVLGWRRN